MHYYSFNIGDYASHTRHLSPTEDIAYRRMLDLYYLSEKPLPEDPTEVTRLINMRDYPSDVMTVLEEFFTPVEGTGWVNARVDAEISKYHGKRESASRAGRASVESKLNKRSTDVQQTFNTNSTGVQPTNNHKPITNNQEPENNNQLSFVSMKPPARKTESPSEKFKLFWDAYPKKVEKVDCVKVWKDKKLDNQFDEIMAGLERYKQSGYVLDDDGKWTKAPHRWLEKERWTDIDLPRPKKTDKPAGDIAPLAYPPSDPRHPNHSEYDPAYDTTAKADLRRAARGEGDPRDYLIWAIEKYYPGKMAELGYTITTEPDNPKCRFYERGPNFKPLVTP